MIQVGKKNSLNISENDKRSYNILYNQQNPFSLVFLKKVELMRHLKYSTPSMFPNFLIISDDFDETNLSELTLRSMMYQKTDPVIMIQQFFKLARCYCQPTQQNFINTFQGKCLSGYQTKDFMLEILYEYTKPTFFHGLLNNILRSSKDPLQMYYSQYFVNALSQAINYRSPKTILRKRGFFCYRGAFFTIPEKKMLKQSIGKLIKTLGFLSTSLRKEVALDFGINGFTLLVIYIPDSQVYEDQYKYAMLKDFSLYQKQEQVLFSPLSIFEVIDVIFDNYIQRQVIFLKYKNVEQINLINYQQMQPMNVRQILLYYNYYRPLPPTTYKQLKQQNQKRMSFFQTQYKKKCEQVDQFQCITKSANKQAAIQYLQKYQNLLLMHGEEYKVKLSYIRYQLVELYLNKKQKQQQLNKLIQIAQAKYENRLQKFEASDDIAQVSNYAKALTIYFASNKQYTKVENIQLHQILQFPNDASGRAQSNLLVFSQLFIKLKLRLSKFIFQPNIQQQKAIVKNFLKEILRYFVPQQNSGQKQQLTYIISNIQENFDSVKQRSESFFEKMFTYFILSQNIDYTNFNIQQFFNHFKKDINIQQFFNRFQKDIMMLSFNNSIIQKFNNQDISIYWFWDKIYLKNLLQVQRQLKHKYSIKFHKLLNQLLECKFVDDQLVDMLNFIQQYDQQILSRIGDERVYKYLTNQAFKVTLMKLLKMPESADTLINYLVEQEFNQILLEQYLGEDFIQWKQRNHTIKKIQKIPQCCGNNEEKLYQQAEIPHNKL